jgi:hypothetical protein
MPSTLGAGDVPSSQPKVQVTAKTWDPWINPVVIGGEVHETWQIIWNFIRCFAFSLKELGQLKWQEVQIILEYDNLIFKQPYKFSEVERTLVQAQTSKLLGASLVELSRGEYASTIVMLAKKDIFDNWIKH